MPADHRSKQKRITAIILGLMVLVGMLFSAFYVVAEADHDCAGEDCPICAGLQQCENTLHQIGDGLAFQLAVIVLIVFLFVSVCRSALRFPLETPVSRKVRLNQ